MFADSFCDSDWANRSHRGWTTLASFAAQALAVGLLLMLPLIYTQGLPRLTLISQPLVPAPRSAAPPASQHTTPTNAPQTNMVGEHLMIPPQIPPTVVMLSETAAPPPAVDPNALGVSHGTGGPGGRGGVWDSILTANAVAPPMPTPVAHPPRISHMMEGNLIHRVQPIYPEMAKVAHIQGTVVLQAVISRQGVIQNLQLVSGHPLLVQSAIDAVRQWRYRPYYLNNEPVEVDTQVTVNFILAR